MSSSSEGSAAGAVEHDAVQTGSTCWMMKSTSARHSKSSESVQYTLSRTLLARLLVPRYQP